VVDARGTVRPVRAAIRELPADLTPTASRLGHEDELVTVSRIEHGAGYESDSARWPPDPAATSGRSWTHCWIETRVGLPL